MPMYDKYPYTDFHEMNLDWIIREMKQLIDDWEEFSGRVTATAHTSADPEVDVTGDLKTTLNFDFGLVQGPRGLTGAQGPQGEQGPAGEGLEILDEYVTLAALQAAHPTGNPGDAYLVGSGGSFTLYIWSTDQSAWLDAGALSSPSPSTTAPAMDGTAAVGSSNRYARADHVHPSDTSKLDASATDGVYAVDSGAQTMLDYADTSTADALVQYDSVGDINTRGLTATGTINTDTLNVANNTILNSSKLNGIAGSSNACQVLTTVSASIDPLVMGSDLQTNTPTVKFTGCKVDNNGTINSGTSEVFFTESFGIDSMNYNESRISLAPADASMIGGVKIGSGISVDADGTISADVVESSVTVTPVTVDNSSLYAMKQGNVVFLNGYVVMKAQTYTANSTVVFTLSEIPSAIRFIELFNITSQGSNNYVFKIDTSGNCVVNTNITFSTTTYLFVNATIPL